MNNQPGKISFERAMEMSLDEYISETGIWVAPKRGKNKQLNEKIDIEMENQKYLIEGEEKMVGKKPKPFDLRDKFYQMRLSSPVSSPSMLNTNIPLPSTNVSSLQQRLINTQFGNKNDHQNIPPAISVTDVGNRKPKKRYRRNRKNGCGINSFNKGDRGQCMDFNKTLDGKIQKRFENRNNYNSGYHSRQQSTVFKNATTIECTLPYFENDSKTNFSSSNNTDVMNFNNQMISNNLINSNPAVSTAISKTEIKPELMPIIAEKILNLLMNQKVETNQQKYDLKLQKEIHSIQGKNLIFKCPGGDVISSDGPGINCEFRPAATGISLNHRFA